MISGEGNDIYIEALDMLDYTLVFAVQVREPIKSLIADSLFAGSCNEMFMCLSIGCMNFSD